MTLDGLDCFKYIQIFCFPNELLFSRLDFTCKHSNDIYTVKIKIIRNIHAVLANQNTDIWHFNDNISKANYFLISSYGNVVGFELFL